MMHRIINYEMELIEVNRIYLPTLKYIRIKHYSLYPQSADFTFNFIEGVNLIIGGNGIGKTTFINLIKYGLIGLYRKGLDVRSYNNAKKEHRRSYANEFFRKRMNYEYPFNKDAEITLTFYIDDVQFKVTRSLYNIELKEVTVTENGREYNLQGKSILQHKYDKFAPDDIEKEKYLQYHFEEKVTQHLNVGSFNDLIFLVNQVLFFGENRETILWDEDAQERLSSKYFNDPVLDMEYEDCKRNAKYNDSLARHKSEDIRAITLLLDKLKNKNIENDELDTITKINQLRDKIEKTKELIIDLQNLRKAFENNLRFKKTKKANLNKSLKELESDLIYEESLVYKDIWQKINPDYHLYLENIKHIHICPMCNQKLNDKKLEKILGDLDSCLLCEEPINASGNDSVKMSRLRVEITNLLVEIRNQEIEIVTDENELEKMDLEYRAETNKLFDMQKKIRDLEHILNNQHSTDDTTTYREMYQEIDALEEEKKGYQAMSNEYKKRANEVLNDLNEELAAITRDLSSIFKEYAEAFLRVECKLSYEDYKGQSRKYYVPVIDGKERLDEEELSESQRFFIDHSFRMSVLEFFYQQPTFFVCETPDSSLDISYEENAAKVFLRFLQKPNALIITTNLNNSTFLEHIINNEDQINILNLLEYGRPSSIQIDSDLLQNISNKIRRKISG